MTAIMFQGTGSNVGKSIFVAGLCRLAKKKKISVAPFKPQNMSNNSFVTIDNGEIGRSQAFQAFSCGIEPHSDMNPVLLKPESDSMCQIVLNGKVFKTIKAINYKFYKRRLLEVAYQSFLRLKEKYDLILVEGAGSPAEINLRKNDIANMGFATRAKLPVVLIGDIDRGGVIAQIVGTKEVLSLNDRKLISGFIINKFRGNPSLFEKGYEFIYKKTKWPGYGIIPWFEDCNKFPAEDSFDINFKKKKEKKYKIVCLQLSRISNFDDLDPLAQESDVSVVMLKAGERIPNDTDFVIIPGSKSTINEILFIKKNKWDKDLKKHLDRGKHILGICAGFQILGKEINDPNYFESKKKKISGLGLLDISTFMQAQKKTIKVSALHIESGLTYDGYEIHLGKTIGPDCKNPFSIINGRDDGAISKNGLVMGSYVHGMFKDNLFRSFFLKKILGIESNYNYRKNLNKALDDFSDIINKNIQVNKILNF